MLCVNTSAPYYALLPAILCMPIQIPTWAWTLLQAPGKVHWAETTPTCPIPQEDNWTVFLSWFFLKFFLKFKSASWIHLLWKPPTYSVHCSIHQVSRCCPVIQGWCGNQGFQDRIAVRQGMVPLIAHYVVCDTWGVTIQAAPELLLLSQRCVVFVGVHPDKTVLENNYSICWVCTNLSLGDGQISDNRSPPHGLRTSVCNTWWQTLARKMQTVSIARGSLVLTKAYF